MRVTTSMMVRSTLRDLSSSLGRLQATQTRLSTGKQLTKASDDPTVAADAMSLRRQLERSSQRTRALNDADGWLGAADSALTAGLDRLARAKEIAVRAANTGALPDANARLALATEIRSIREDLIGLANSTVGGRSIFNGTATGPAYDAAGTYLGNTASVVRDVAPKTTVAVNLTGPQIFGVGGGPVGNVFEVLDRLANAVAAGDSSAIATEHANLDARDADAGFGDRRDRLTRSTSHRDPIALGGREPAAPFAVEHRRGRRHRRRHDHGEGTGELVSGGPAVGRQDPAAIAARLPALTSGPPGHPDGEVPCADANGTLLCAVQ